MTGTKAVLGVGALCGLVTACGAAGSDEAGSEPAAAGAAEGPVLTEEELQGELARVQAELGEASCATTTADAVFDGAIGGNGSNSPNAAYGHPTCRNGYIADVNNAKAGFTFYSTTALPNWLDPFSCLLNYGYLAVYRKQGTGYVRVFEQANPGVWTVGRFGTVCTPQATFKLPADGDYKAVVAAGNVFGGFYPVRFFYFLVS